MEWCRNFPCNDVVALSSAALTVSAGVTGGFVIYFCLKNAVDDTCCALVYPIQTFKDQ